MFYSSLKNFFTCHKLSKAVPLSALLLAVVLVSGCTGSTQNTAVNPADSSSEEPKTMKEYKDENISFEYPSDWSADDSQKNENTFVDLLSPGAENGQGITMSISSQFEDESLSLSDEEYQKILEEYLFPNEKENSNVNVTVTDVSSVFIDNIPAKKYRANLIYPDDFNLSILSYVYNSGGYGYSVCFESISEKILDEYKPTIDNIMESYKITDNSAQNGPSENSSNAENHDETYIDENNIDENYIDYIDESYFDENYIDENFEWVEKPTLKNTYDLISAVGVVRNKTSKTLNATIKFKAYDYNGNQIDTPIAGISNLSGGSTWKFETTPVEGASRFEFYEISS